MQPQPTLAQVLVVGDTLVDELASSSGSVEQRHPGGAGLNLAAGLARLGHPSSLVSSLGDDGDGRWLTTYASEHGVRLFAVLSEAGTGVAMSQRHRGEPTYVFNEAMFNRDFRITGAAAEAASSAAAVAITTFPFHDVAQTSALHETLRTVSAVVIVDPNPRPALITDRNAFREGFEAILAVADLVKISDEDVTFLYGESETDDVSERLIALGAKVVIQTHGPRGASMRAADGEFVTVPVAELPGEVIDTMGAGDATLAAIVSGVASLDRRAIMGAPMASILEDAMLIAAATCRAFGGALRLPGSTAKCASNSEH